MMLFPPSLSGDNPDVRKTGVPVIFRYYVLMLATPQYWDLDLGLADVLGRIGLAIFFGAVIGWERQRRGQAAGIQTLVLVSIGAALFVIAAQEIIVTAKVPDRITNMVTVIAGVIGGVGFLGAGSIIQIKGRVEGITTAAAIWVTAGVGLVCGLGEFVLAGIGGLATVSTLFWVGTASTTPGRRLGGELVEPTTPPADKT